MIDLAPSDAYAAQPPAYRHAGRADYAAFLRTRPSVHEPRHYLSAYARFVAAYPDLRAWFTAPLRERVGRLYGETARAPSARARPYLYFLAWRGDIAFDWAWLFAVRQHTLPDDLVDPRVTRLTCTLADVAATLGYSRTAAEGKLKRVLTCLYLHHGAPHLDRLGLAEIADLRQAVVAFGQRPDVALFYGSAARCQQTVAEYTAALHLLHVALYHHGQVAAEPRRGHGTPPRHPGPTPRMEAVVERYLQARRAQGTRPATIERLGWVLRHFIAWLAHAYPALDSFAAVTREHVLAYAAMLEDARAPKTGRPLTVETKITRLSSLSVFFRDITAWGWPDTPGRPLLGARDLPKRPLRVPRYIPDDQLAQLMSAIRLLPCPYQRAALLIARWSGARRGEIRNLERNCLDAYPDGTPRLRIPVGKGRSERIVPLHEEAATAIRAVQGLGQAGRGFRDEQTGVVAHRLFVHRGQRYSATYLFEESLKKACAQAGLVGPDGAPLVNAHRFRHTVATQLAERGAKLHTIMKILGHTSVGMTMVYTYISDREVLRDYQTVLGPGAAIAGPCADQIRQGDLSPSAIDWLATNFLKTELELGRCLRLPQEGPCECDLCLSCAKFVTTPAYAPRLRRRRRVEGELIADAQNRGWARDVERHQRTMARIDQLLAELGEPLDGPEEGA